MNTELADILCSLLPFLTYIDYALFILLSFLSFTKEE